MTKQETCANCGHEKKYHRYGCNENLHPNSGGWTICPCKKFIPAQSPTNPQGEIDIGSMRVPLGEDKTPDTNDLFPKEVYGDTIHSQSKTAVRIGIGINSNNSDALRGCGKLKLRTLKDLFPVSFMLNGTKLQASYEPINIEQTLKEEAIKWAKAEDKELMPCVNSGNLSEWKWHMGVRTFIIEFFNLTEEELK